MTSDGWGSAGFVHAALARAEPIVVAVPAFRAGPLRQALGADAQRAVFIDLTELGRNPARIIPAVTEYAMDHAGKRVNCVGECTGPGRTGPELNEAIRQEALANLALQDMRPGRTAHRPLRTTIRVHMRPDQQEPAVPPRQPMT